MKKIELRLEKAGKKPGNIGQDNHPAQSEGNGLHQNFQSPKSSLVNG